MKVDYIEIRESVLPKSIGARYKKGVGKHLIILSVMAIICIVSVFCLKAGEIVKGFITATVHKQAFHRTFIQGS